MTAGETATYPITGVGVLVLAASADATCSLTGVGAAQIAANSGDTNKSTGIQSQTHCNVRHVDTIQNIGQNISHGCGVGELYCHAVHLDKMAQEHEPKPSLPCFHGASITLARTDSPGVVE